jgi:hypothetical protein
MLSDQVNLALQGYCRGFESGPNQCRPPAILRSLFVSQRGWVVSEPRPAGQLRQATPLAPRQTTSTKSPYPPNVSSSVKRIIGSNRACATRSRSNGSL